MSTSVHALHVSCILDFGIRFSVLQCFRLQGSGLFWKKTGSSTRCSWQSYNGIVSEKLWLMSFREGQYIFAWHYFLFSWIKSICTDICSRWMEKLGSGYMLFFLIISHFLKLNQHISAGGRARDLVDQGLVLITHCIYCPCACLWEPSDCILGSGPRIQKGLGLG